MDEAQKQGLRDKGMTEDEINELIASRAEKSETESFLGDLKVATVSEQKKMVQEKANYLTYKAALTEDRYEQKRIDKVAYKLKSAARYSGGLFDVS